MVDMTIKLFLSANSIINMFKTELNVCKHVSLCISSTLAGMFLKFHKKLWMVAFVSVTLLHSKVSCISIRTFVYNSSLYQSVVIA